jgi:hypothetical protein
MEHAVHRSVGLEACYKKGWVQSPTASVEYLSSLQQMLASRGDQATVAQFRQKYLGMVQYLKPEDCRSLELYALQHVQAEAKRKQDYQELGDTLDGITQNNIQQMNAYRPRTTMCQSAGIMVACNTF